MPASIHFLQVDSGAPLRPRRILRREWKRNKPHLPKSTSLPILQLTPIDRPIFTCRQCGFVNTLIPLCLWCCWTSEAADREFETSMPRVRRASAPSRVVWKYSAHTSATSSKRPTVAQVFDLNLSSGVNAVPRSDLQDGKIQDNHRNNDSYRRASPNAEAGKRVRTTTNLHRAARHKRHHHNVLHETFFDAVHNIQGRVARATSSNSSSAGNASRPRAHTVGARPCYRSIPPSLVIPPPLTVPAGRQSPSLKGVDRPHSMDDMKTLSTKSLCSVPIVIDFKSFDKSNHDLIKSQSIPDNLNPVFPPRPLRRRQGISLFRTSHPRTASSSPTPLDLPPPLRPASGPRVNQIPQTRNYDPLSLSLSLVRERDHVRSKSHPTSNVPLGHPNRPYYTAIRSNMSRPSSTVEPQSRPQSFSSAQLSVEVSRPLSLPPPARASSPGILSMLSTPSIFSTSAFEEHHEYLPRPSSASAPSSAYDHVHQSPFAFAGPMSRHRHGFSLSGETELRMAIARDQIEMLGPGSGEETFRFRDMRKTSRRETRVLKKVKKLKKGLKDFVLKAL